MLEMNKAFMLYFIKSTNLFSTAYKQRGICNHGKRLKTIAFTLFKPHCILHLCCPCLELYDYLLLLKGSSYSFTLSLSKTISCVSYSAIYFFTVVSFNPIVET